MRVDTETGDSPSSTALLDATLADLRAVGVALERVDKQFQVDRARTEAAVNEARLAVDELRSEVRELLQTLRTDVHATVLHIEAMLAARSVPADAFADLAARVAYLERALGGDAG